MTKWKNVRVRQELLEEVETEVKKEEYKSLSEFVSEAIQLRLGSLTKERVSEYLERDKSSRITQLQGQLFYTPNHIWIEPTPQGNIRIGVSDYFENQLKAIVYVGTSQIGEDIRKGQPFGTVETVAGWPFVIHDMISPVDGKIIKVNKEVIDDPYILNGNAYQWIIEIQPNNPEISKELEELLNFEEYTRFITDLENRPRVPLSASELSEIVKEIKH